ncbi:hypothetical protein F7734_36215 [Scytonema sp. UIC 10036]|uniref:DUF7925 domain-containing protein n=1 Tax=Scytonema sp. UIC 10036 TaxID=2304196 RepID=UPI0012DADCE7|nr:hypothetical protein [Scytonema sp. UIC 10036]MUG97477.1 hypothetical protein [Scytonema sp. UIC 10036]
MPATYKLPPGKTKFYLYLIATGLLAHSFFQYVTPVKAEGTNAGQSISNTATATYEDPNNPGTTINTTSNTVVVTVAEVAGVTVTGSGTSFKTDQNTDGKIGVGDTIYYTYNVTNVGNDPTQFRIPDQPTVTGPGQLDGAVQISYDGGKTWTDVVPGGTLTNSIPPGGSVLVQVPVKVADGATSGSTISVKLGDTPSDAQNQPRSENGGDLYTVDNPDGTQGEVNGVPVNGTREASATQQVTVDSNLKNYTLATILKTRSSQTSAGVIGPGGDTLSYELSLRVENNEPTGNGISPAPLNGTEIPGLTGSNILVSDAIPAGTKLTSAKAPAGWQIVYTSSDTSSDANQATWTTTAPSDLATVKRIGFVRTESIAPGTTVTGFQIIVEVLGTPESVLIANIAQLFGKTPGGAPVYDESGDQNPSNFDGSNPPTGTDTNGDKIPDTLPPDSVDDGFIPPTDSNNNGIPDKLEQIGTDTNNNNSATGPGGEANIVTLTAGGGVSVLNGPKDAPDAVAENDNNKDFTNKSSLVPAGTVPGTSIDPDGVSFTNTLKNTGTGSSNISLIPTTPTNVDDLPVNTLVTISYDSLSATYKYDGTNFVFQSGQGKVDNQDISATNPIRINNIAANATANYGVEVNLPSGTRLSTDINRGFPVPITAYIENNETAGFQKGEPSNITIDRVYTGFLKMVKLSRVLQGTGPAVRTGQDNFETTPGIGDVPDDVPRTPASGNIIEYQIRYKNISEPQSGTGNIVLNAGKVIITEDGTTWDGTKGNNWALDNDNNSIIDTSHVAGSAKDSGAATIAFFKGKPATTSTGDQTGTTINDDVTKYVDTVTDTVTPGQERTFTFQRKVN